MAASTASTVAPVLAWDKNQSQTKAQRKKSNPLLFVAMAAIALLAFSGVWRAMHMAPPGKFIKVVTAVRDLPAGSRLGFFQLRFLDVPKELTTKDMVVSLADVNDRVIRTFVPAGEPILMSDLFPGHDGLSVSLENDERAITLQLSDDALVDHAILPDDRVDLLAVSSHDGKQYTKTICQDTRVLMCAPKEQQLARHLGTANNNKITLAVSPQLAEYVTEAAETGKIRCVLRNRLGQSAQHLLGVEPNDLLPAKALAVANVKPANLSVHSLLLPAPPTVPTEMTAAVPAAEQPGPVQWLVDVFTGAHKETYGVPVK
jgi:Flp pilus assembly protein CpaB